MKQSKTITKSDSSTITGKKKIVFNVLMVVIALLLIILLEGALRIFGYGKDLSLFLKSNKYPGYYEINNDVNLRYFTRVKNTSPTEDIFLINKPDTCFRIFVFGGSTTRGFPYQEGTAFPRILYYRLQDAYPDKRIEVINLSASAINSYTFIDMADEVFKNKPDAILVYGGHNEYYGAMGVGSVENGGNARWLKKLRLKLTRLRTFQMVQNAVLKITAAIKKARPNEKTLMERIVKDKDITIDSPLYQAGIDQFKDNLTELINKAKKHNVPLILSDLVSNVKDLQPFESVSQQGTSKAGKVFDEAKQQENSGNYDKAKELFYKAKDIDAIRFRAPEAFNQVIYDLGKDYSLTVVPVKKYFEENSPNGLIGDNLMIDHLHPKIDGYFILADAFFNTITKSKLIEDKCDSTLMKSRQYYRNNWGFTELDSLIGDLSIKTIKSGWPFRPENEKNTFLHTYIAKGVVDSMAFTYVTAGEGRHIENEHIKLAQYYAKNGQNEKAFKEYYSLIKMHPYIFDLYYDASRYLINQQKYKEALTLINSSPIIIKDYYYYYMTGSLLLKTGDTNQAIKSLEYAYKNIPKNTDPTNIINPLYVAYKNINDTVNEARIKKILDEKNPGFKVTTDPNHPVKNKVTVDQVYNIATSLVQNGSYDDAIKILLQADDFEQNFKVKKLLGALYMKKGNNEAAFDYCRTAFEINPKDYGNLNNLYIIYLTRSDLKNAKNMLDQIENLKQNPEKTQRLNDLYKKKKIEIETMKN